MTANEKKQIERVLAETIIDEGVPGIVLSRINGILKGNEISASIYAGKLKEWLQQNFADAFYISKANIAYYIGSQYPAARKAEVIEAILMDKLQDGQRVFCPNIPSIISTATKNQIDYTMFSEGQRMECWLFQTFPSFKKDTDSNSLIIAPEEPLKKEVLLMQKIVNEDILQRCNSWLRKAINNSGIGNNALKNIIATHFWYSLLGKKNLCVRIQEDGFADLAFNTGLVNKAGKAIYCLMDVNKADAALSWHISMYCCPEEPSTNEKVKWLQREIGLFGLNYLEVQSALEQLDAQRLTLVDRIELLRLSLQGGLAPNQEVFSELRAYENAWTSLITLLSEHSLLPDGELSLDALKTVTNHNNTLLKLRDEILSTFKRVTDYVNHFIRDTLSVAQAKTTPESDYETVVELYGQKERIESFAEFEDLLSSYSALYRIMLSANANDLKIDLETVFEHFEEILPIPKMLVNKAENDLNQIGQVQTVQSLIVQYCDISREKDDDQTETICMAPCAGDLYTEMETDFSVFSIKAICYLNALLPDFEDEKRIVFAEGMDESNSTNELSPFGAAERLIESGTDEGSLAERYFLLGFPFDSDRCGKGLLRLYRKQNNVDAFLRVWRLTSGDLRDEEDILFWISILQNEEESTDSYLNELQRILKTQGEMLQNSAIKEFFLKILEGTSSISTARKHRIVCNEIQMNQFEEAVADNDISKIFAVSDDAKTMESLGYSNNEIERIRAQLRNEIPGGISLYEKGIRILFVQGTKNNVAETLFWQAEDRQSLMALQKLYYNNSDYNSVVWMTENYDMVSYNDTNVIRQYAISLSKLNSEKALERIAQLYPEIWYCEGVLDSLVKVSNSTQSVYWKEIHDWTVNNPFVSPTEPERTIVEGSYDEIVVLLHNSDVLLEQELSLEQKSELLDRIADLPVSSDVPSVAHRIYSLIKNRHRLYEKYLLDSLSSNRSWALAKLYQLYVEEKRYLDAVAYYRAYSLVLDSERIKRDYLWCLVGLDEKATFWEEAKNNIGVLLRDEQLCNMAFAIAQELGEQKEAEIIRGQMLVEPRNRFERGLIRLDKMILQEFISTPSKLEAIGYTWEQIERIKVAFIKPFPEGDDAFSVSDRVRKFLGDHRAEPFFLASEQDKRSARALFDIFTKEKRWDDLCDLYQRHDPVLTWNEHYYQLYLSALQKSTSSENCSVLLSLIQKGAVSLQDDVDMQWTMLRTFLGIGDIENVLEREREILSHKESFDISRLISLFDMAWTRNIQDMKDYVVSLAGRVLRTYKTNHFTVEEQKVIVSANNYLTSDTEDVVYWAKFLKRQRLSEMLRLLNLYFGFTLMTNPKEKEIFLEKQTEILKSINPERTNANLLQPYFASMRYLEPDEPGYNEYTTHLINAFVKAFSQKAEESDEMWILLGFILTTNYFSADQITILFNRLYDELGIERLYDLFDGMIRRCDYSNMEKAKEIIIVDMLTFIPWSVQQLHDILNCLSERKAFHSEVITNFVRVQTAEKSPVLYYYWTKQKYLYYAGIGEPDFDQKRQLLLELFACAQKIDLSLLHDASDLELLYEAACINPAPQQISFLHDLFASANKEEESSILSAFSQDMIGERRGIVLTWLLDVLEQKSIEWIEHFNNWWKKLIQLNEEDLQTKASVKYLGLSDNDINEQTQNSVARILISDIHNVDYLKCFHRVLKHTGRLTDEITDKLNFLRAINDPSQLSQTIKNCFASKKFGLGIRLLRIQISQPISNSAELGILLADIYTEDNVMASEELIQILPEIYMWIHNMNQSDPGGEWKNLLRASKIAEITKSEDQFFSSFQSDLFFSKYPGLVAACIAKLILRREFESAKKWINHALVKSRSEYLLILDYVLDESVKSKELSLVDELIVKSIPENGNMRSLEFYGDYVFNAFKQGKQEALIPALEYLFETLQDDKAYLSTLVYLYYLLPQNPENSIWLFNIVKKYFLLTAENNVDRVSSMLAIIHACLPSDCQEKRENVREYCMRCRYRDADYTDVVDLENQCILWLNESADQEAVIRFTLEAVTGHWEFDAVFFQMMSTASTVSNTLTKMHPRSFCSACIRASLLNKNKPGVIRQIEEVLKLYNQDRIANNLCYINNLSDAQAMHLSNILTLPTEIPHHYLNSLKAIVSTHLDEADENALQSELMLCFASNEKIHVDYKSKTSELRNYVESLNNDTIVRVIQRVVTQINFEVAESKGIIAQPQVYLSQDSESLQDKYYMVVKSAEHHKNELLRRGSLSQIKEEIYDTYIRLGETLLSVLRNQDAIPAGSRKKEISLRRYLNMANLICQYGTPSELKSLLSFCPAKYKICVRCLQELIQGCPKNILYVMENDAFWTNHVGCSSFIYRMAYDFFIRPIITRKESTGVKLLSKENRERGRDNKWGIADTEEIQKHSVKFDRSSIVLNVIFRNPFKQNEVDEFDFRSNIDELMEEMKLEDGKKSLEKQEKANDDGAKSEAGRIPLTNPDYHSVPFVTKMVNRWKASNIEPNIDEDSNDIFGKFEVPDSIKKYIVDNWDKPDDLAVRRKCVDLGFALFDNSCETRGLRVLVTPEAREIFYQIGSIVSDKMDTSELSDRARSGLQMCLESYTDLASFLLDCMKEPILPLCKLISDNPVQNAFRDYIHHVCQFGTKLSCPMTNDERYEALSNEIKFCRTSQTAIDSSLKNNLVSLINQEMNQLMDLPNVKIEVYNEEGALEEGYIFGRIQNAGNMTVRNIQMELDINGRFYRKYTLKYLEGMSMVPFALKYHFDFNDTILEYKLIAAYETEESKQETTRAVTGALKLVDMEERVIRAVYYETDKPSSESDYVERPKLQMEIEGYYPNDVSFDSLPTLAVYGMRRTGKSSILKKMERLLYTNFGESALIVETSGEGATSGSMAHCVHSILVRQVLTYHGREWGHVSLADYYEGDSAWTAFCEKWMEMSVSESDYQWVEDFYMELSRTYLTSHNLFVLIDEVDKVYAETNDQSTQTNLWDIFSRITQRRTIPVRFVFCGSDAFTNKMVLEGDNLTQFFQRIERVRVGQMTAKELEQVIKRLEQRRNTNIVFHPDSIPYLWTLCGGLPWHSRKVVNECIHSQLIQESRNIIYPSDIAAGMDGILKSAFTTTDNTTGVVALTEDERAFLSILAEKSDTMKAAIKERNLYEAFCTWAGESECKDRFMRAKNLLQTERQIISVEQSTEGPVYRFACEVYRLFYRREKFVNEFVTM